MAKQIGTCDICLLPVLSNQGRMAQKGRIYKDGSEQFSKEKLWWHTACFAQKNFGIEISREPLNEEVTR